MTGRIETYIHSDMTTPNKGAALVRVNSETDFGSRTESFIAFSRLVARYAYASQAKSWSDIIAAFPDLEDMRMTLHKDLREKITVDEIVILNV